MSQAAQARRPGTVPDRSDVASALRSVGLDVTRVVVLAGAHIDRAVFLAELDGARVAVKCYGDGRSQASFDLQSLLWASPFGRREPPGLPRPLAHVDQLHAVVSELVDGRPLGSRGDPGQSVEHAAAAAELLVDLQACGVLSARRRGGFAVIRSVERKVAELGGELAQAAALRVAQLLPDDEMTPVLSHGDFTPRNLLLSRRGLRLIDFDRVRTASPARDVAYWCAWAWATDLLMGHAADWTVGGHFLDAYCAARSTADPDMRRELPFHRAAALVRIAHGWSVLRENRAVREAVLEEAVRTPATF